MDKDFEPLPVKCERLERELAAAKIQSNIDRDTIEGAKEYIRAAEKQRDGYREIAEEAAELGKSQAVEFDTEVEKLEAHNAVLRGALERCRKAFVNLIDLSLLPSEEYEKETHELAQMCFSALHATPSDSAAKVQGLVSAMTHIDGCLSESEHNAIIALEIAQKALAEWRGE